MNDTRDQIERLAMRARAEEMPVGDVRQAVLGKIRRREQEAIEPLTLFATGYAAVGLVAVGFAVVLFNAISDPLSAMFQFGNVISP